MPSESRLAKLDGARNLPRERKDALNGWKPLRDPRPEDGLLPENDLLQEAPPHQGRCGQDQKHDPPDVSKVLFFMKKRDLFAIYRLAFHCLSIMDIVGAVSTSI